MLNIKKANVNNPNMIISILVLKDALLQFTFSGFFCRTPVVSSLLICLVIWPISMLLSFGLDTLVSPFRISKFRRKSKTIANSNSVDITNISDMAR